MHSKGVAYLTSEDQVLLLRLACADLDKAAAVVYRLGAKSHDPLLWGFDPFYLDLKAGASSFALDRGRSAELERLGLNPTDKAVEKRVKKMEKYVAAIARLHAKMAVLSELEASERRMELQQRRHSGPIPMQKQGAPLVPTRSHALAACLARA